MTDFKSKEYRAFCDKKFRDAHKQIKVNFDKETDRDIIGALSIQKNKSAFVRKAIRFYLKMEGCIYGQE